MARLRFNNLANSLGGALSSGATAVTFATPLTYNNGQAVPTLTGSDYIPLSVDLSTSSFEVLWLTAYSTGATTGTIARGQDGTTGIAHNSGATLADAPNTADYTVPFLTGNFAGDVNGTTIASQVVSTTLSAPLPINQGGTGSNTGAVSGDLSGTLPGPTVAKIQGVAQTTGTANILSGLAGAVTRSASSTMVAGEQTIYTGSTAAQTLTLPTTPQVSTLAVITNLATVSVTVAASGNTINKMGTVGSLTLQPNDTYTLVFIGTVWYVVETNTFSTLSNTAGHATASVPVFVSGTALQINANQDVMLYITTTAAVNPLAITIGPTTGAENTIRASANQVTNTTISFRVPGSWRVVITGTIANMSFTAITC